MSETKTTKVQIVEQDEPVPVVIADVGQPLPVEVVATQPDPHTSTRTISNYTPQRTTVARADDMVASPTTTAEEDLVTAGQRNINRVWEYTQSAISLIVVITTATGVLAGRFQLTTSPLPAEWWTIVGLVIGFYFSRSNHTRTGGVHSGSQSR